MTFLRIVGVALMLATTRLQATQKSGELPAVHNHPVTYPIPQPNMGVPDDALKLQYWVSSVTKPGGSYDDTKLYNFSPTYRKIRPKFNRYVKRRMGSLTGTETLQENATSVHGSAKPMGSRKDLLSFSHLVTDMAQQMSTCELVLAYDDGYSDPEVLEGVLLLSNVRQVSTKRQDMYFDTGQ